MGKAERKVYHRPARLLQAQMIISGLRARLLLLLGVAVLPAVALLLIGRSAEQQATTRELHTQAMNLARLTGQAHAQRIEVARQLLISLANHPAMRAADAADCNRLVRALTAQYEGTYATIGRAKTDGVVDCLAFDDAPAGMSIADRDYFQRAKATGNFVTGDFMHGKIRRQPTLAFALPLRDPSGVATYVIFANFDLTVLSRELETRTQMAGTTLSLLDRQGTLIARSSDADRFFGVKASGAQLQAMRSNGEMVSTFWGPDGIQRVFAIAAIRDRRDDIVAFSTVGVPVSTVTALLDPSARREWLTIGLLAVGLFLVAWGGSELLIRRPIAKLVAATQGLASGALDQRTAPVGGARELQVLGAALNQMAGKLQERELHLREGQRLEAVGQLAGGIAHDFNNLLTVIIGYADALKDSFPAGSAEHAQLAELRAASERAARLTQQLLAFSRRQILLPTPLQLNEVVGDMVSLLRRTTGGDVVIDIALDPTLPLVFADRVQMEQVILNLVLNARDAMPSGGHLKISTRTAGAKATRQVELAVSDSGVGMDASTRARIFEPFFTTKGTRGTGLGLATVYGIVKQSDGDIHCESEPEAGTTFRIQLPAYSQSVITAEDTPAPQPVGGDETLVLVDDDDSVRGLLDLVLRRRGYNVRSTRHPSEALQWMADGLRPDLLITDVRMPDMSGPSFARAARQFDPQLRILFMSGDAAPSLARHEHIDRATFEQKPITPPVLLRAVRARLDEPRLG
jgi:two-component system cell cycle sensor histidine kinase/response regulator CckA